MTREPLCPFCGAYSPRSCDLLEEGGVCPWEEIKDDPDYVLEDSKERDRLREEYPDDED